MSRCSKRLHRSFKPRGGVSQRVVLKDCASRIFLLMWFYRVMLNCTRLKLRFKAEAAAALPKLQFLGFCLMGL